MNLRNSRPGRPLKHNKQKRYPVARGRSETLQSAAKAKVEHALLAYQNHPTAARAPKIVLLLRELSLNKGARSPLGLAVVAELQAQIEAERARLKALRKKP